MDNPKQMMTMKITPDMIIRRKVEGSDHEHIVDHQFRYTVRTCRPLEYKFEYSSDEFQEKRAHDMIDHAIYGQFRQMITKELHELRMILYNNKPQDYRMGYSAYITFDQLSKFEEKIKSICNLMEGNDA